MRLSAARGSAVNASLEADTRHLVEVLVEAGLDEGYIRSEIAKLVRAYDPCLSCSVH